MENINSMLEQENSPHSDAFNAAINRINGLKTTEEINNFLIDLGTNKIKTASNDEKMQLRSAISTKLKEHKSVYPNNLSGWNQGFREDTIETYRKEGYKAALDAIDAEIEYVNTKGTPPELIEESNTFIALLKEELKKMEDSKNPAS